MLYPLVRQALFALDAERAHGLTLAALKLRPETAQSFDARLRTRVGSLVLPSPVGLAAGFDKHGEVPDAVLALGFGFVEIGTVTPLAQPGNPRPRLFRLAADRGVINRFGFNSQGHDVVAARLTRRSRRGIVGVNIGANKDAVANDRAIDDYVAGVRRFAPLADYLTVNVSSPNTPGLRDLQGDALPELLDAVMGAASAPVLLKVAPDLIGAQVDFVTRAALDAGVAGLIVGNTTVSRPPLRSRYAGESGGLSGQPLKPLALAALSAFRGASGSALPLVAAGGIASADDVWARLQAGASAVQLYSALVYEGPGLAKRIGRELIERMTRERVGSIAEIVSSN